MLLVDQKMLRVRKTTWKKIWKRCIGMFFIIKIDLECILYYKQIIGWRSDKKIFAPALIITFERVCSKCYGVTWTVQIEKISEYWSASELDAYAKRTTSLTLFVSVSVYLFSLFVSSSLCLSLSFGFMLRVRGAFNGLMKSYNYSYCLKMEMINNCFA